MTKPHTDEYVYATASYSHLHPITAYAHSANDHSMKIIIHRAERSRSAAPMSFDYAQDEEYRGQFNPNS